MLINGTFILSTTAIIYPYLLGCTTNKVYQKILPKMYVCIQFNWDTTFVLETSKLVPFLRNDNLSQIEITYVNFTLC